MVGFLSGSCNICVSITHFSIVSHSYNKREQQNWNNEEWQNNWIILIIPDISPAVKIYTKIIEHERKTLNLMADLFTLEANFRFRLLLWSEIKMTEQSEVSHARAHEDYSQPDGLLKTSHPLSWQLKSDVTSWSHTNSCTHARSQLKHTGSS